VSRGNELAKARPAPLAPEVLRKKAELISEGMIHVPKGLHLPVYPSRSTAGPGSGHTSLAFDIGGTHVKLGISREPSRFTLAQSKDAFMILEGDKTYLDGVQIAPILMHAPGQAFINIDTQCIYRCVFCNSWQLEEAWVKDYPVEKWAKLIIDASKRPGFGAVAITSSVPVSVKDTVEKILKLLYLIKKELPPGTPIGVEPCISDPKDIIRLKDAGVTELKINVQAASGEIFDRICPGQSYPRIFDIIEEAGKHLPVCSNIILGLGETDGEVISTVERLAKLKCAATLRALRIDDRNRGPLSKALGFEVRPVGPERLVRLAMAQKEVFERYGLAPSDFKTMCHRCVCCDIVPFRDV
jgi:biotin synthase-related radical SAM superfamily protein